MITYGVVEVAGVKLSFCEDCGVLVVSREQHSMWHVNTIGGLQSGVSAIGRTDR